VRDPETCQRAVLANGPAVWALETGYRGSSDFIAFEPKSSMGLLS